MEAATPILSLRDFGVAFGERVVLGKVDLDIPGPGLHVIMGPVGGGKSTLLRTLCGLSQASPSFRAWGEATYLGSPLEKAARKPALVAQQSRLLLSSVLENVLCELPDRDQLTLADKRQVARSLLAESGLEGCIPEMDRPAVGLPLAVQRHLALARTAACGAPLLCVDEPTADLEPQEKGPLLEYLRVLGTQRAVLVVTHNRQDALALGGQVILLAGGLVHAHLDTRRFFEQPPGDVAAEFVRTGSCSLPCASARPEEVEEPYRSRLPIWPEPARMAWPSSRGPQGFLWLKEGALAGTPRPGVVRDLDDDLEALKRVGITVLVSLTTTPVDARALERHGIEGLWLPIPDMQAPSIEQALSLCRQVHALIAAGEAVAYHCRAGHGRTGTLLAAHLILEGQSALAALESVRRIEPRWVQSDAQIRFLERFAQTLADRRESNPALGGYFQPTE